eukprot:3244383-Rhodomonas_salina.3
MCIRDSPPPLSLLPRAPRRAGWLQVSPENEELALDTLIATFEGALGTLCPSPIPSYARVRYHPMPYSDTILCPRPLPSYSLVRYHPTSYLRSLSTPQLSYPPTLVP